MTNEPVRGTAKAGRLKALGMLSLAAVLVAAGGLGAAAQPADPRLDRNRPAAGARVPAAQTPRAAPGSRFVRPPQLPGPRGPAGPSLQAPGLRGPAATGLPGPARRGPDARPGLPVRPDLSAGTPDPSAGTPGLRPAGRPGLAGRPDAVRPNPLRPDMPPAGDPRLRDARGERGPAAGLPARPRPGAPPSAGSAAAGTPTAVPPGGHPGAGGPAAAGPGPAGAGRPGVLPRPAALPPAGGRGTPAAVGPGGPAGAGGRNAALPRPGDRPGVRPGPGGPGGAGFGRPGGPGQAFGPGGPGRPGFAGPGRPGGFGGPGGPGPGRYGGFRSPAAAAWATMRQRFYVPPPRPVGPPPGMGIGRTEHERVYSGLPPRGETRYIPREVVVQVADTVPRADVEAAARRLGIAVVSSHGFEGTGRTLYQFRTADGRDVRDVIRSLERERVVASAQPNYVYRLDQVTSDIVAPAAAEAPPSSAVETPPVRGPPAEAAAADPAAPAAPAEAAPEAAAGEPAPAAAAASLQPLPPGDPGQYIIAKLKLGEAHAQARGRKVAIAVIDSDVDARHPDMHGAVTERFDPAGTAARPHLHGTGMAGAIVAKYRLRGVAPEATIVAVKAFDERSAGPEATTFQILKGLDHAMRRGVRVVNMSFAGPYDVMIERKLKEAYDRGIVLVAAAGNAGPKSPPLYPAADPNVIAVTATDQADAPLAQANRGKHIAVAAPGVDILVPAPGGAYQLTTGTSVAAAHVSGVVALMLEKRPDLTPDEVRAILVGSAAPITGTAETETGAGLVDPVEALTFEPEMPEEPAVASGTPAKRKAPAAAAAATPIPSATTRTAPRPAAASGKAVE